MRRSTAASARIDALSSTYAARILAAKQTPPPLLLMVVVVVVVVVVAARPVCSTGTPPRLFASTPVSDQL
jgi:hypothetical protein